MLTLCERRGKWLQKNTERRMAARDPAKLTSGQPAEKGCFSRRRPVPGACSWPVRLGASGLALLGDGEGWTRPQTLASTPACSSTSCTPPGPLDWSGPPLPTNPLQRHLLRLVPRYPSFCQVGQHHTSVDGHPLPNCIPKAAQESTGFVPHVQPRGLMLRRIRLIDRHSTLL